MTNNSAGGRSRLLIRFLILSTVGIFLLGTSLKLDLRESTSDDYKHGCNQGNRVGVGEKITAEEEGQVKAQETSNQKETGQLPDQIKTVVSNEEKPNEDVLSEKVELDANLDQRQAGSHDNPKEQDKAAANPEQLSQVVANPDQLRQAAADPRSFGQAAASPMQFRQVANNHQPFGQAPDNTQSFGQAVIDSKQFGEAAANSQPFGQAAVNSEHFGEAASNPEQAKQVEANPEQSKQAAANPEQLEQVVNPDPLTAAGKQTFAMNLCNCSRTINASNWESEGVRYEQTTCGTEAFRRGKGQKVNAFSFYLTSDVVRMKARGYFEGIRTNLELMATHYPGWVMRVYYNLDGRPEMLSDLCGLACTNEQLDICDAGKLPGMPMADARNVFPMIWRFFATLDPQVDIYNCRDLDSIFTAREVAAVNQWLESPAPGKIVHSMRDHPRHVFPMLGAGWGTLLTVPGARYLWKASWEKILSDHETYKPYINRRHDQNVLTKHVWPWAKASSVQHDAFNCMNFTGTIPFPTQRLRGKYNFIAAMSQNSQLHSKCPLECRPKDHPEWEYC